MRRTETPEPIWIKFCTVVDISDVVTYTNRLRGLWVAGGQISPSPIDFHRRPYNTLALPCERVMNQFVLRVDHSALAALLRLPNPVGLSAGWLDIIADYNFEIQYRSGALHRNAGSLNRRPCTPDERFPCRQCKKSIPGAAECQQVTRQHSYMGHPYVCRSRLSDCESAWVSADIGKLLDSMAYLKGRLKRQLNRQRCWLSVDEDGNRSVHEPLSSRSTKNRRFRMVWHRAPESATINHI